MELTVLFVVVYVWKDVVWTQALLTLSVNIKGEGGESKPRIAGNQNQNQNRNQ